VPFSLLTLSSRTPLHDVRPPLADRTARALAREGWGADDVHEVQDLCGPRTAQVLSAVVRGDWPDRSPRTVVAWLRAGGQPLLDAMEDPGLHRRQVEGMRCWSRTYGELGPLAHAAGLSLPEAAHLLAAGSLTRPLLEQRRADRPPAAVLSSWSDNLRPAV
jgi:hypothetical protein